VAYTILRLDELEWSKPSAGDQSRGIIRLSDRLEHMRANIWSLPAGARGRRHAERVQEEIFVVLSGTATLTLGDPPQAIDIRRGSLVIVEPGTPVQLRNDGDDETAVLAVGAPADTTRAEYLPDA